MREWLKTLRGQKNLSQKEMATILNMSQVHYCNIENGYKQADMNMSIAAKIADYFDIPLSKIRLYEEERIKNESAEPRQRGA